MKKITTISDLKSYLHKAKTQSEFGKIMNSIDVNQEEFLKYSNWSEDFYTRNCIDESKDFQLILLCWNCGQKTMIHDHDGQSGWIRVIKGGVFEDLYSYPKNGNIPEYIKTTKCTEGMVAHITDEVGLHKISNIHKDEKSMTLHLYVNPVNNAKLFNEDTGDIVEKTPKYYSVDGVLA